MDGWGVVAYMRGSVLVSELVLFWALLRYVVVMRSDLLHVDTIFPVTISSDYAGRHGILLMFSLSRSSPNQATANIVTLAIAFHPGFLILDSVHFQYNGFLFGIMLWSLVGAKEVSRLPFSRLSIRLHTGGVVREVGNEADLQGKPIMCAGFFAALLNFK